jgi:hypothetical protein
MSEGLIAVCLRPHVKCVSRPAERPDTSTFQGLVGVCIEAS